MFLSLCLLVPHIQIILWPCIMSSITLFDTHLATSRNHSNHTSCSPCVSYSLIHLHVCHFHWPCIILFHYSCGIHIIHLVPIYPRIPCVTYLSTYLTHILDVFRTSYVISIILFHIFPWPYNTSCCTCSCTKSMAYTLLHLSDISVVTVGIIQYR